MREKPETESPEPEGALELDEPDHGGEDESGGHPESDHDSEEMLDPTLPDYLQEACDNARALARICEVMGLGEPNNHHLPALIEGVWKDHHHNHPDEPYFWEHGGEGGL